MIPTRVYAVVTPKEAAEKNRLCCTFVSLPLEPMQFEKHIADVTTFKRKDACSKLSW